MVIEDINKSYLNIEELEKRKEDYEFNIEKKRRRREF